jgi:inner membrane protein
MDSFTHIALGGSIAALIAPSKWRRQALVAGAIFGSLPDIDVPILIAISRDPVTHVTWHRGPAHSLAVIVPVGIALWSLLRRWWTPVRKAPRRWFWALMLPLLSHPLLDALTVYGTQLWWPSHASPTMWSTLFIIDPVVLLPVWVGAIAAWCWREQARARIWAASGLIVCAAYVAWSICAKQLVERAVVASIEDTPYAHAPHFTVPTPFNTLLWRVVVMTPGGYLEGYRSLVADRGPIRFRAYPSDHAALAEVAGFPDAERLRWFASGFVKAQVRGDEIVISDLRMGGEPDYFFSYAVAQRGAGGWQPIAPQYAAWSTPGGMTLRTLWRRIWQEPAADREATDALSTHVP